jgi:hypothetical protein
MGVKFCRLNGGDWLAFLGEKQGLNPGQVVGLGSVFFAHLFAPEQVRFCMNRLFGDFRDKSPGFGYERRKRVCSHPKGGFLHGKYQKPMTSLA